MRVSQMMSVNLVTCSADETVGDACRRLTAAGVGSVLVTRDHALVGMLTERDVLKMVADGANPESDRVSVRMTRDVVGVPPDADVIDVAELMNAKRFRHLPVIEGGTPV